jgi:hypothetical protein
MLVIQAVRDTLFVAGPGRLRQTPDPLLKPPVPTTLRIARQRADFIFLSLDSTTYRVGRADDVQSAYSNRAGHYVGLDTQSLMSTEFAVRGCRAQGVRQRRRQE